MNTRLLESKNVLRASVTKAAVLNITKHSVALRTTATVTVPVGVSSADSEMVNRHKLANVGDQVEGRVGIDVLADNVIRVRYAEGATVPDNVTPMLVSTLGGPTRCVIKRSPQPLAVVGEIAPWLRTTETKSPGSVTVTTGKLQIGIGLDPYRLEVRDRKGKLLTSVGGPEKNSFCNWDAINTGICRARTDGRPIATENFDLAHDECIYGLGEKFIKLNKVGQTIDLNTSDALGVTTPRSYKNIPFYVSTHGYGVFFNHSSLMTYWVGSRSAVDVQVAAEDDFLDYFIITGSIKEVLATYTELTGKGALPPKWTFGFWQSKFSYQSADETMEIVRKMREHKIPCDVLHLDTHWFKQDWFCDLQFDKERFPNPKKYFEELAALGIKISLWQLPYIPEGSKLFDDLKAVDGFVKTRDGKIYNSGVCFVKGFKGISGVVDYTNPAAVKIHQDAFRKLFRLGAKVIKTDFGEAAPLDGVYHDGTPGHRMHNLYPLLYNQAIFDVTKEETGDGVVWARSAWAGNQRYPLYWGGDNSPNYANMLPQVEGGLSFGLSGFQFWSQDIGGFCGATNDQLLIRWMQLGMFLSHSRIHGVGDREVYKFAKKTMETCREYIRLRYRLMPYIYGMARKCVESSLPFARALVVDYQDDPTVWNMSDEFLFGDDVLVAPIFDGGTTRRVYLPRGTWTDWWTKKRIPGNQWIDVKASLEKIPLYIREGALIPMGPVMNYVDAKPVEKIELLVSLFEGNGRTKFLIPVNNEWVPVDYTATRGKHNIRIGKSTAKFAVKALGRGTVRVTCA